MKNLICFILVAFLATTTFAQRKGMAVKVDAAVERLTNELDLTPEQQVKIKAIYEAKIENRQQRRAETKKDYAAARENFNQEIEAVLTPEQIEKRKSLNAEYKEKMKAIRQDRKTEDRVHRKEQRAESRAYKGKKRAAKLAGMSPEMIENRAVKSTEKLDRQVSLTEEQQVTVKSAYQSFFQKNQAIASDASLDAAAKKEMLSSLKADHKATIKSLLTEEQLAAKKANKKMKKGKRAQQQH